MTFSKIAKKYNYLYYVTKVGKAHCLFIANNFTFANVRSDFILFQIDKKRNNLKLSFEGFC
jgi:hypothetical protein